MNWNSQVADGGAHLTITEETYDVVLNIGNLDGFAQNRNEMGLSPTHPQAVDDVHVPLLRASFECGAIYA